MVISDKCCGELGNLYYGKMPSRARVIAKPKLREISKLCAQELLYSQPFKDSIKLTGMKNFSSSLLLGPDHLSGLKAFASAPKISVE